MTYFKLSKMVKEHALAFGEFTLSSGTKTDYFLDLSKITNHAEALDIITLEFARKIDHAVDAIGGPALGAAPLISGTILTHRRDHYGVTRPLRGFLVRKEPKEGTYIEGNLKAGDNVVIVEDVVTTGRQVLQAIKRTEEAGGRVVGVFAVVDRQQGAKELLADYHFESLLTIDEIFANLEPPAGNS